MKYPITEVLFSILVSDGYVIAQNILLKWKKQTIKYIYSY